MVSYLCSMSEIGQNIEKAKYLLENGNLVAIPTETVYGLAANALDEDAVLKIFDAKKRPHFDPLIVHIKGKEDLNIYARRVPEPAIRLANTFWPGPLTLLLPKSNLISDLVTSGSDLVGLRIPSHPLTLSLLKQLSFPLAAPSANPFGYISPTTAQHVYEQLSDNVSYILDGGACQIGLESTIIGFEDDQAVLMRLGGIAIEDLEKICWKLKINLNQSSNPLAPGQLKSHYAPKKPLMLGNIGNLLKIRTEQSIGVISFKTKYEGTAIAKQWILSEKGDLHEAASNLFKMLREADKENIELILGEYVPDEGLGLAINDRLKRAAAK